MAIRAVWFDVGEALIDETREYGMWADWLGVPRHTFSAVFGAVIARGGDYREVFQHFDPVFDLDTARQERLDSGLGEEEQWKTTESRGTSAGRRRRMQVRVRMPGREGRENGRERAAA